MSRPVFIFMTALLSLALVAWGVFSLRPGEKSSSTRTNSGSVAVKPEGDLPSSGEEADTFPGNWARGKELFRKGYYSKAEQYLSKSIDQATTADKDSEIYADALLTLARIQSAQWREKKAVPLACEGIRILIKKWGPDSVHVADGLVVLADAIYAINSDDSPSGGDFMTEIKGLKLLEIDESHMDNYDAAMLLYRRALAIQQKKYGNQTPFATDALIGIATVYFATGRMDESRKYCQWALKVTEGADKVMRANALTSLGWLDHREDRNEEAQRELLEALSLQEVALGHQHPDAGITCFDLAQFYEAQGNKAEAKKYYERALRIVMKRLRPDHPLADTMRAGVQSNS